MPNRFTTPEIIAQVESLSSEIEAYREIMTGQVKEIAGYIEAYSPDSGLEIRYITSEGRDDEKWRGNLLAKSPGKQKVDIWLVTVTVSSSMPLSALAVNENGRNYTLGVDYYLDYKFGTDANNTESVFNEKVDGFERLLDEIRTCLPSGAILQNWLFQRMIKRFTNASTHIAKGDLAFTIEF